MKAHILSASQFNQHQLAMIFQLSFYIKGVMRHGLQLKLGTNKGISLFFFEPSIRTISSFESAAQNLNIPVISTIRSWEETSMPKGESFEDTIQTLCDRPNVGILVIRHPHVNSANIVADIADNFGVSVINAGDGTNEHPTQSLLDLFTIVERQHTHHTKDLKDIKIVFAGDLTRSRTIRSLCILLAFNYPPKEIGICAPSGINLPDDLVQIITSKGITIRSFESINEAGQWADYVYMTRPQRERFDVKDREALIHSFRGFQITKEFFSGTKCCVLHPLPIDKDLFNEIDDDACEHPQCLIWRQVENGVYVRMALMKFLLDDQNHELRF